MARISEVILPGYEHFPLLYNHSYHYRYNYFELSQKLKDLQPSDPIVMKWYRALIKKDLFFIVYFHLNIKKANHPWVIDRCNEVQNDTDKGNDIDVLDIWAREHFKSTILTTAKPIQKILRNPEERICIFSFKQDAARRFYEPIKTLFEKDTYLISLFPNILSNDQREYELWTRDLGFTVLRKGFYREPTLMWSALSEGMPTGMHFTGKIYDDIMTADMSKSPQDMERSKQMFDMSQNLRDSEMDTEVALTGRYKNHEANKDDTVEWQVIAGTPYHFNDTLKHIQSLENQDGTPAYKVRKYPATHNGNGDGRPVLLSQASLDRLKRDKASFSSQQLLNPLQDSNRSLNWNYLVKVSKEQLPKNLWKFLLVDPAGDTETNSTKGDRWAIALLGVEPNRDDFGLSSVYILDLFIRRGEMDEIIRKICNMYMFGGRIVKLCVEKVATSTYEIHIANALKKFGRHLSVKNKNLMLLRPGARNKHQRIKSALNWPVTNGKVHYLDTIPSQDLATLKEEMDQFPLGSDDGLDILSYYVDAIKDYKFPRAESSIAVSKAPINDLYRADDEPDHRSNDIRSWMVGG